MSSTKKIIITGGHLTPALAVMEKLQLEEWQILLVGRKHSLEGDPALSIEYKIITAKGLKFLAITTGRLQRSFTRYTLFSLAKVPLGFFQSLYYLLKFKPDIILSFGSYVALPVVLAGWVLKIPVITHEQSVVPGLATKIISKFARKICVSWPETIQFFPKEKVILTGNPIREEIFDINSRNLGRSIPGIGRLDKKLPLIYITGGNLGSHVINEVINQILPKLLDRYLVIHQCGNSQAYNDFEKLRTRNLELKTELRNRYVLTKYVESHDIGWVLNNADFVISRAGANIVTELAALGKPSILIPLPWAGQQEQRANARLLEKAGTAIILPQEKLTGENLYQCIESLRQNLGRYEKNSQEAQKLVNRKAADKVVKVVNETQN